DLIRRFEYIAKQMPKIDGYALEYSFDEPDSITSNAIDCAECSWESPLSLVRYYDSLRSPGENLREYKFRVASVRRQLARDTIVDYVTTAEEIITALTRDYAGASDNCPMDDCHEWHQLRTAIKSIDAVLGDATARPPRWSDLSRHLHFALKSDFNDIRQFD